MKPKERFDYAQLEYLRGALLVPIIKMKKEEIQRLKSNNVYSGNGNKKH